MLGIGEFAGLTGLSVKALRHYDEKVVLVPAEVDALSGYRRYGEGQVRAGVVARALRDAGVPLPAVAAVVAAGGASDALTEHRRRVLEDRASEDRALAAAEEALRALAVPVAVDEREMARQPFVGQVISVSVDDAESLSDVDANAVFGGLFEQLQASGLGPSGQFWTTLRAGERGTVEVVWPTPTEVDDEWCGPQTFAGVLPARTELVATWRPAEGETLPDGPTHPAVVALFDAIAGRQIELRGMEVRQTVLGQSEEDYAVEVSVSVETR
ncbi:MerR family DNA-binding transcriptional regulator [Micromonospora sp. MW-13]|uniref:MerR family DNA-binding transcriptional regulator n=1 Tax=Micromonospora sp. MW-13 TaxID=2094022 RepID=UPI000E434D08|nr:MerR family DNA-binding transcriptional regulator [Micromonospora sp. MW-13]